jgi:hypothetical protein
MQENKHYSQCHTTFTSTQVPKKRKTHTASIYCTKKWYASRTTVYCTLYIYVITNNFLHTLYFDDIRTMAHRMDLDEKHHRINRRW